MTGSFWIDLRQSAVDLLASFADPLTGNPLNGRTASAPTLPILSCWRGKDALDCCPAKLGCPTLFVPRRNFFWNECL